MNLEQAISIASLAHEGQLDKSGESYILHPLRVMMKLKDYDLRIIAVLHDVIEDCGLTLDNLVSKYGVPFELARIVDILSRKEGESYDEYIERISKNYKALKVKLADLEDNMDLSRIKNLTQKDYDRVAKYAKAREKLVNKLFNMI